MKVLGLIPARFASSRFPGKPLAHIVGKPMIQWVYQRAKSVFDDVFVATDDDNIFEAVSAFGGRVVMTSSHHQSGTDRCAEALEAVEKMLGLTFDVVANIQGDEPFVFSQQLKQLVHPFKSENLQISTLVKPFLKNEDIFNPSKPKVVLGDDNQALYFSRAAIPYLRGFDKDKWTQNHVFYKHIGLYAYKRNILLEITQLKQTPLEIAESLEQLRWLENGYSIYAGITEQESLSVDTPQDLEKAIEWAKKNKLL